MSDPEFELEEPKRKDSKKEVLTDYFLKGLFVGGGKILGMCIMIGMIGLVLWFLGFDIRTLK